MQGGDQVSWKVTVVAAAVLLLPLPHVASCDSPVTDGSMLYFNWHCHSCVAQILLSGVTTLHSTHKTTGAI